MNPLTDFDNYLAKIGSDMLFYFEINKNDYYLFAAIMLILIPFLIFIYSIIIKSEENKFLEEEKEELKNKNINADPLNSITPFDSKSVSDEFNDGNSDYLDWILLILGRIFYCQKPFSSIIDNNSIPQCLSTNQFFKT